MAKLENLVGIRGFYSLNALLEAYIVDSVCPAITCNDSCDYAEEMEPDRDRGWCPECQTNKMKSALIFARLI